MTNEQREEILVALRHGREADEELEPILLEDLEALEPLIDRWLAEARNGVP